MPGRNAIAGKLTLLEQSEIEIVEPTNSLVLRSNVDEKMDSGHCVGDHFIGL
jgi:hypothetical protein